MAVIRRLAMVLFVSILSACFAHSALGEKLQLLNGLFLEGEPVAFDTRGVVVRLGNGEYAPREAWTNFTQTALKQLAGNPKAKQYVEPYIEEEDEPETPKRAAVELRLKPVPRLDRPSSKTNSLFGSPLSTMIFLLLYLANIYAGLEVARYRKQHPGLVCGLAAVAPVVGPIIFLSMPTRALVTPEEPAYAAAPEAGIPAESAAVTSADAAAVPADQAAQAAAAPAAVLPPPTIYRRPQTTFNRRFFETKLAGFLRVVPSDAEKDMILCISSTRGNYVGQRIMRIMPNELMLLVKKGEASSDVLIPFNEVTEVQVRHRDLGAGSH